MTHQQLWGRNTRLMTKPWCCQNTCRPPSPTITPPTQTCFFLSTHKKASNHYDFKVTVVIGWNSCGGCEAHNHTHTRHLCLFSQKINSIQRAKCSVHALFSEDITMAVPPKTKTQLMSLTAWAVCWRVCWVCKRSRAVPDQLQCIRDVCVCVCVSAFSIWDALKLKCFTSASQCNCKNIWLKKALFQIQHGVNVKQIHVKYLCRKKYEGK